MGISIFFTGLVLFFLSLFVVIAVVKMKFGGFNFLMVVGMIIGFTISGQGMRMIGAGDPKTSIKTGSYEVVGYAEILQDKQPYYQMILEQDGEVRFYSLPKDMIDTTPSGAKGGTLEVVEKSGLRKAILYLPLPVN